jgi:hypothetical protein
MLPDSDSKKFTDMTGHATLGEEANASRAPWNQTINSAKQTLA